MRSVLRSAIILLCCLASTLAGALSPEAKLLLLFPASTTISPASVPGLIAWYDASDDATISIGTGVSQWNDKSATGANLVQATGSKQPTRVNTQNGKKVLTFNSAAAQVLVSSATPTINNNFLTVFTVVRRGSNAGYHPMFICGYAISSGIGLLFTGSIGQDWQNNDFALLGKGYISGSAPRIVASGSATTDDVWHQFDGVVGTSGQALYADGVALTNRVNSAASVPSVTAAFQVGGSTGTADWFNGDIAEEFIYSTSSPLPAGTISGLRTYLKAKWGTP